HAQVGFVHQGRRVQRVTELLVTQASMGQLPKLLVDTREQLVQRRHEAKMTDTIRRGKQRTVCCDHIAAVPPHSGPHSQMQRALGLCVVAGAMLAGALGACAGRPGATPDAPESPQDVSVSTCCGDSAMGIALRSASDYRESALATRVF